MTLGETIYLLRTQRNMSQGDLAEALEVSRQSISKWETNSAVPELDKLIKLSKIFGVTLDELVCGKAPEDSQVQQPAPEHAPSRQSATFSGRKIAGTILLCMAFFALLLCTVLGSLLGGLILCLPFLLCGIICFVFRRRVGLWCAWMLLFLFDVYLRYATGITWRLTLLTPIYEPSWNYTRLAFAYIELICMVVMLIATLVSFRHSAFVPAKRALLGLLFSWAALIAAHFALNALAFAASAISVWGNVLYLLSDWVRLCGLTAVLVFTLGVLRGKKAAQRASRPLT